MIKIKTYLCIAILTCLSFQVFSQNTMETECMQRIKKFSSNIHFPIFTGQIVVSKDTIKFDNSVIVVRATKSDIVKIFECGIIFPDLIHGASTRGDKYEIKKMVSGDTISIGNVEELHFPSESMGTKWFSFLLWQSFTILSDKVHMANPSLYIFELTNENANLNTSIKDFIEKAKVTSFGFCSLLI